MKVKDDAAEIGRSTRPGLFIVALLLSGVLLHASWRGDPHAPSGPSFLYNDLESARKLKFRQWTELEWPRGPPVGTTTTGTAKTGGETSPPRRKVAIIGAGALGSSLAYFLHGMIPPADLATSVFDRMSHPGGRAFAVGLEDPCRNQTIAIEVGASIFTEGNQFMMNLSQKMDLGLKNETDFPPDPKGTRMIGLWNGVEFLYNFSGGFWSIPAAFWRWGLSITRGKNIAAEAEGKWRRVYEMLERGEYVDSPGELLRKLDGLDDLVTGTPAWDYLSGRGLTDRYLEEFAEPTTLVNYFQPLKSINPLAALVSMTAAYTLTHQIRGGNFQLFEKLLASSRAQWVGSTVIEEIRRGSGAKAAKFVLRDREGRKYGPFDDVVLTGPLPLLNISMPDDIQIPPFPREFVTVHVTLVAGIVDPAYFNLPLNTQPPLEVIVPAVTATAVPFHSFSTVYRFPCLNEGQNVTVTKIFSEEVLSAAEISRMFAKTFDTRRFKFPAAYPYLDPFKTPDEMPGFGPYGSGIWFGGAFEAAFSCMEGQIVSASNLAGLIARNILMK